MLSETPSKVHASGVSVPFNRPRPAGNELRYIEDAIVRSHLSGNGFYTRQCESRLSAILGGGRVLLTTSCTHALEMAALLLDLQPGDEFILPSFTFVSTANAFALRGARPVFVDIRPDTLNIDETRIRAAVTPKTRAIVVVHYAGIACAMQAILDVGRALGVPVIEDNAHGLFGTYRGRPLGTFGSMSALSFHDTKNVFCGEGGALVLNEPQIVERAEVVREKGTDRSRFFRGEVDRYTWRDIGSSYVPSEILAAFLYAQLEQSDTTQQMRRVIWEEYARALQPWACSNGYQLPVVPDDCTPAYHLFYVIAPTAGMRDALLKHLSERGVHALFHYLPLHTSEMGRKFGYHAGDFPITESVSERILRLPFFSTMTAEEQRLVTDAVVSFRPDASHA